MEDDDDDDDDDDIDKQGRFAYGYGLEFALKEVGFERIYFSTTVQWSLLQ